MSFYEVPEWISSDLEFMAFGKKTPRIQRMTSRWLVNQVR